MIESLKSLTQAEDLLVGNLFLVVVPTACYALLLACVSQVPFVFVFVSVFDVDRMTSLQASLQSCSRTTVTLQQRVWRRGVSQAARWAKNDALWQPPAVLSLEHVLLVRHAQPHKRKLNNDSANDIVKSTQHAWQCCSHCLRIH